MANRSDDFNRTGPVPLGGSTPSDGGGPWSDPSNDFETGADGSGNVVAFDPGGVSGAVAWLDCGGTDHQAEAECIRLDSSGGVITRAQDANNYYLFRQLSGGTSDLFKRVGGAFTSLGAGPSGFTPGVGNKFSLKSVGSTHTPYNGTTAGTPVTDSSLTTGTNAGIASGGTSPFVFYNSFDITDLSGGGGPTYTLTASQATFSLTGEAAGLTAGRLLAAAEAGFALTGEATGLLAGRVLTASQASFTLTGEPVTLTYTPLSGPTFTLGTAAGSFALTGEAVGLLAGRVLGTAAGDFTLTGTAAGLTAGRVLSGATGTLTLTGESVGLVVSRVLALETGEYTLTGLAATLRYSGAVTPGRIATIPGTDRSGVVIPGTDRSAVAFPADLTE